MQLGFIGTGEITSSIVTGLCSFGTTSHSIRLSPRNAVVARELSNRFGGISVASSNQEVLDHSDTNVIAVRPAVTRGILSELRFGPDHQNHQSRFRALARESVEARAACNSNREGCATPVNR